tara:strand:+ start:2075 stop:2236 length:162 start_codon:yes stop_codon:yes gene_type:complete
MNGAITDPWAKINKPPNISNTAIIGANQSFFRYLRNKKISASNFILLAFKIVA